MGCYILSWYNPHFWVFRSMKLQRVTMTTGINPRDAEECQQSWIYISREKTGRYAVLCCAQMSFWNSYTSSCAELKLKHIKYTYMSRYIWIETSCISHNIMYPPNLGTLLWPVWVLLHICSRCLVSKRFKRTLVCLNKVSWIEFKFLILFYPWATLNFHFSC